ncbi:FlgO family outer membrane protein [Pseudoalteromonas sp. T1lg75]|uniref:FlgO family outer membrane protein n=1 Tax=Pseudoalteromonas sp. T1lg75 TaxID=2077102 RepID=UPI000CF6E34B|nr:FlgO family outer membrane protein [Pseudoalteromonas sp. T1lg75]
MNKLALTLALAALAGCAQQHGIANADAASTQVEGNEGEANPRLHVDKAFFQGERTYYPQLNAQSKTINVYIQELAQELAVNLDQASITTALAVTTFTYVDSDLNQGSLLGNHVAESLMHELHQLRVPVIDFKLTRHIRVTPEGDFALSRDYLDLESATAAQYLLTGTLTDSSDGVLVNARIVAVQSRTLVASGQILLPGSTVMALQSRQVEEETGVLLKN